MTLAQCFLFWRLAIGNLSSIAPNADFNEEFERGLFKEVSSGEWVLRKNHPEYRAYWCEAFENFARTLYTQSPAQHLFYLGHTLHLQDACAHPVDLLAVVSHAHASTIARLTDITARLNQCLQGARASWKTTNRPRGLTLHIQNAHTQWIFPKTSQPHHPGSMSGLRPEDMAVLVGSTAWFVHRNQLTGLSIEPRLARCYAQDWTAAGAGILARGTHEHRMEFKRCWQRRLFTPVLLNNIKLGMVNFLHANDTINPQDKAWSSGLEAFMRNDVLNDDILALEGNAFSHLLQSSIP